MLRRSIRSVAFSCDGNLLVSGSEESLVDIVSLLLEEIAFNSFDSLTQFYHGPTANCRAWLRLEKACSGSALAGHAFVWPHTRPSFSLRAALTALIPIAWATCVLLSLKSELKNPIYCTI
jgi:hypothetical protein